MRRRGADVFALALVIGVLLVVVAIGEALIAHPLTWMVLGVVAVYVVVVKVRNAPKWIPSISVLDANKEPLEQIEYPPCDSHDRAVAIMNAQFERFRQANPSRTASAQVDRLDADGTRRTVTTTLIRRGTATDDAESR